MAGKLSPALELALRMTMEDEAIPAYLCDEQPQNVADIERCALGRGAVDAEGGIIAVQRDGVAECIAYDVKGQLAVSRTTGMPCRVYAGARCKVGPLAFGKDGKPHGA